MRIHNMRVWECLYGEGRCRIHPTGGPPPLTTISKTSALRSSRGNSCGAIPTISTIINPSAAKPVQAQNLPSRSPGAGGYAFAADPDLQSDRVPIVWLPDLDPAAVLVTPAPETFANASPIGSLTPAFRSRAADGEHWLVGDGPSRLPLVLIGGASAATPAAVVIPLDGDFAARADAALRLWCVATGRLRGRPPDRLTPQQRQRLQLILRALDGRLAGHSYRVIAQGLFGETRIPAEPGWKTHDLRDRTIRLCRRGLKLMRGGYLDLLHHPRQSRE